MKDEISHWFTLVSAPAGAYLWEKWFRMRFVAPAATAVCTAMEGVECPNSRALSYRLSSWVASWTITLLFLLE